MHPFAPSANQLTTLCMAHVGLHSKHTSWLLIFASMFILRVCDRTLAAAMHTNRSKQLSPVVSVSMGTLQDDCAQDSCARVIYTISVGSKLVRLRSLIIHGH
eukprot:scaffold164015_cov21-Tisochrysis_lutea.AAC.3